MNVVSLKNYIEQTYNTSGEYLFAKDPETCVFRHKNNRKWFAIIMEISKSKLGFDEDSNVYVVNLKCDPRVIGSFRMEQGIYPAYHMNKGHWLTVALDGTVAESKLQYLLEMSYFLTKGKNK